MKNKLPWLLAAVALMVALAALLIAWRSAALAEGYARQTGLSKPQVGQSGLPNSAKLATGTPNQIVRMDSATDPGSSRTAKSGEQGAEEGVAAKTPEVGHRLTFQINDGSGKPVARALVRVLFAGLSQKQSVSAHSDAQGKAIVGGVDAPSADAVSVEAEGYERNDITAVIPLPFEETFNVTLNALAGTRIEVREIARGISDPAQATPYRGRAHLYLMRRQNPDSAATTTSTTNVAGRQTFETIESKDVDFTNGSYLAQNLTPGSYRAIVTTENEYAESEIFEVQARTSGEAVVLLGRRQEIIALVTAGGTRQPVPGAAVKMRMTSRPTAAGAGPVHSATTDDKGLASFKDLPLGTYVIEASAKGFAPKSIDEIQVLAGPPPPPVPVPLSQGNSSVQVVVADEAGRPIVRAPLVLFAGGVAGPRSFFGQTDEAGSYLFEPVPAGRYTLSINNPENRSRLQRTEEVVVGDGENKRVAVSFARALNLQGKARRAGQPFVGLVSFVARSQGGARHYAKADSAGDFVVELEPGEYIVGHDDQPGQTMVTIVPGQTVVEAEIR